MILIVWHCFKHERPIKQCWKNLTLLKIAFFCQHSYSHSIFIKLQLLLSLFLGLCNKTLRLYTYPIYWLFLVSLLCLIFIFIITVKPLCSGIWLACLKKFHIERFSTLQRGSENKIHVYMYFLYSVSALFCCYMYILHVI